MKSVQSLHSRRNINYLSSASCALDSAAEEIKSRKVCWKTYCLSQLISEADYRFLSDLEASGSAEERDALFDRHGSQCSKTFFLLFSQVSKEQTLQNVLILLDGLLQERKCRVDLLECDTDYDSNCVFSVSLLLNFLSRNDEFISHMACRIITKIICWGKEPVDQKELFVYLNWISQKFQQPGDVYIESVASCLQMLLRIEEYRAPFMAVDGVPVLLKALSGTGSCHFRYQILFCLWLMTFSTDLIEKMNPPDVILSVVDILFASVKTKVIRMALAVLRNFFERLEDPDAIKNVAAMMAQRKVLKQLDILKNRKFNDPELVADIEFLIEKQSLSVEELSTFDEYCMELESGKLQWSVVHRSTAFWVENVAKFNDLDHRMLKKLVACFKTSENPLVLSVAAHDIGQYVCHYPRGKSVLEKLGVKHRAMELLAHGDTGVRFQSLLCLQKIMVHRWEFLEKLLNKETQKTRSSER